jgi:hypothetical protein
MKGSHSTRANANNHANQLNQNNPAYWSSRGVSGPPAAPPRIEAPPGPVPVTTPSTPADGAGQPGKAR